MCVCAYIFINIQHIHKQSFSHACVSACVHLRMCICAHVNAASDAREDCECNTGYTGPNGGTCAACEAGKYKDSPGADACTACPDNSVSPAGVYTCTCTYVYTYTCTCTNTYTYTNICKYV